MWLENETATTSGGKCYAGTPGINIFGEGWGGGGLLLPVCHCLNTVCTFYRSIQRILTAAVINLWQTENETSNFVTPLKIKKINLTIPLREKRLAFRPL